MINLQALKKILDIREEVKMEAEEMACSLKVSFFPYRERANHSILSFTEKLINCFNKVGVQIIPFEDALENGSSKRRKKIGKGIILFAIGEQETGNMPIEFISGMSDNAVVSILEMPGDIHPASSYLDHYNASLYSFTYHMSNIVIPVNENHWLIYNLNSSHPVYSVNEDFEKNILYALIPKLAAPIKPLKIEEFQVEEEAFGTSVSGYRELTEALIDGARSFDETQLYPPGRAIDEMPFRNEFYKRIGKIFMDFRHGMSYGFLAQQIPTAIPPLFTRSQAIGKFGKIAEQADWFEINDQLFVVLNVENEEMIIQVPEVWVLTLKSGSNKTRFNPQKDLIKIGLVNGKMYLQTPRGVKVTSDYKPSFDTKVILAHALANNIICSLEHFIEGDQSFLEEYRENGAGICHWHGYMNPDKSPEGFATYGLENLPVACSSPQSAVYAINGKIDSYIKSKKPVRGFIQIEPQHGTNISCPSIMDFAGFLIAHPDATELGNRYLNVMQKRKEIIEVSSE